MWFYQGNQVCAYLVPVLVSGGRRRRVGEADAEVRVARVWKEDEKNEVRWIKQFRTKKISKNPQIQWHFLFWGRKQVCYNFLFLPFLREKNCKKILPRS